MDKSAIKILSIAPYRFIPARFGGHKAIAFLYKNLSKIIDLNVVSVKSQTINDPLVNYSIHPILSDSVTRYTNVFSIFKIGKIIREKNITHIMTEHPYLGWMLYIIKIIYQKKIIVRSHNIEAIRFKSIGKWWWKILYSYESWVYKMTDVVLFITPEDRNYAIENFGIKSEKSSVVTYGIDLPNTFSDEWKHQAHQTILHENNLPENTRIFFFNGDFGYRPNLDALLILTEKILPILNEQLYNFRLVICGKSIPESVSQSTINNLIVKGFVEDIQLYFGGSDLFINPIFDGGGIKTKLVEALSYDVPAVSFESGAIGIPTEVVGNSLSIVPNMGIAKMVAEIIKMTEISTQLPSSFYEYFSWEHIAEKMIMDIIRIDNI